MLRTREKFDVFHSLDEIHLVFTDKKQISSFYLNSTPRQSLQASYKVIIPTSGKINKLKELEYATHEHSTVSYDIDVLIKSLF